MTKLLEYIYQKLVDLSNVEVLNEKDYPPEERNEMEKLEFPYITFSLTNPDRNVEQDLCFLDIDFWSNTSDIASLEALVSAVDGNSSRENPTGLDELRYFGGGLQVVFYRIFRGSIPDPDIKIRRRQLRYLVKVRFI